MIKGKNISLDLDALSLEDLTALIQSAETKRADKLGQAKQDLIEETRARADKLGLSLNDLFDRPEPVRKTSGSKAKAAVKYRSPDNEEWSGRGKTPRWMTALEATGRSRSEFLVRS